MGKIIKILIVLVFVVIIALLGILFTTDINQYKGQIVQVVKDNTGRDFQINGDLKLAPSLIPTVAVEGVSLGNASWAKDKDMVSVAKFEAQVALIPLLKKNIQVIRLAMIEPVISLETNKDGVGNWVLSTTAAKEEKSDTASSPAQLPALAINELHIEKANISYKDGVTGKLTELVIDEVTINSDSLSDPMELVIKASFNNAPVTANGTLGSVNNLLENKDYPVKLDAELSEVTVSVDGQLAQPMSARGINLNVSMNMNRVSDLNKVAGAELPDVGPIIFKGTISDTKSGYAIKSMTAQVLEYNLSGDVEASITGPRPKIIAKLSSEKLDLSPFQSEEKKEVKKEKVFPSDPLPLDGLKAADADISFSIKSLITKNLTINDVNVKLNLDNGKLKLTNQGKAAGGIISANINLDGSSGKTASINNKLEIKQIELGQLPAIKEKELLTGGKTDITINAKGSGSSVAAIMAGLNGNLLIKTGQGKVSSSALDVASADALMSTLSLLNPGAEKSDGNLLECAVVNFNIKDGIATADNGIGLTTNQLNVIGGGSINLKTEELDIGITPKAREGVGLNLGQLAGLVRVGGTLANPSPKADAEATLKTGLEVGTAVATGGLSLLTGSLLDDSGDEDVKPCDIALGIVPKK
ncbi:MAG: AsmA family protein, partial [Proteobacteria bacterium]|nr:AsmA family protein [Pseudomonadota bacterium]